MVGVVTDTELLTDWLAGSRSPQIVGPVMTRAVISWPPLGDVAHVAPAMVAYG